MGRRVIDKTQVIRNIVNEMCDSSVYAIGFADFTAMPGGNYNGYRYGLSLARKLDDDIIDSVSDGPTKQYFDLYGQINMELNQKAREIAAKLAEAGIRAYAADATASDNSLDSDGKERLAADVSHKLVATRAGIGWIGKTCLLVSERFGPRVRLISILFNERVKPQRKPYDKSQCGKCEICVKACPASAPKNILWDVMNERKDMIDIYECRKKCREMSVKNTGRDISLCGICVSVCPQGGKT